MLAEEGLGRGVRRVLGVTFDKAEEAFAEAEVLRARVDAAGKLEGDKLVAENAELLKLLEGAQIPYADKKRLTDAVSEGQGGVT